MNWRALAVVGSLLLASPALAQTALTRAQNEANINAAIKANGIGAITGPILNTQMNNLAASMATGLDPNTFVTNQAFLQTADTSWSSYFPNPVGIFATHGNQNAIVGYELNDLAANTNALPIAVIGFGKVTTAGNQVFGVYGLGEVWGTTGVAIAAEFTARNKTGVAADTNLPPNLAIGTTTVVPNALQVTCGGLNGCSIGVAISPEGGSTNAFTTAEYIYGSGYSAFGLFIDGASTGNYANEVLKNNGNGEALHILVTGTAQPNNTVMDIENASSVEEFFVKQNGNGFFNGTMQVAGLPTSAGSGGLNVCIDTSGNLYKKASCP